MECTESFVALLSEFRCIFTAPSFPILVSLMTGWVLSHRRRFVTELIWSSGCTRRGYHSRYHRFFSKSVWELDTLTWVLAKLLVALFAATGIVELAVDDIQPDGGEGLARTQGRHREAASEGVVLPSLLSEVVANSWGNSHLPLRPGGGEAAQSWPPHGARGVYPQASRCHVGQ